jgi:CRP-like cAMP-binding protein
MTINTPDMDIDPADIKRSRAIEHSHSGARRIGRRSSVAYQALSASGLFSKIDSDILSAAAEQLELVHFAAGDAMADQSSRCGHVYVIISGKVKVAYRRSEGREMVLSILGPKEIFGALMLFDPEAHEITATALTEVVAVSIDRDRFLMWIAQCPGFSDQLLRLFARWVKASTTSLFDSALADVQSRVANQLLFLRKRFGQLEGEVVRVVHDLTLEEFSLLVRVAPDRVCETLRVFQNRGWIRLEDNSVVVVDAHALSSVSHANTAEAFCA